MSIGLVALYKDPKSSFISPSLWLAKFIFSWKAGRSRTHTIIFNTIMIFSIIYAIDNLATLIIEDDISKNFVNFILYSAFHLGAVKIIHFVKNSDKWLDVVTYATRIESDALNGDNIEYKNIFIRYKRIIYMIVAVFYFMGWFTNWSMLLKMIIDNFVYIDNMSYFNAWLPFDKNTTTGKVIDMTFQGIYLEYGGIFVLMWDSMMLSLMVFFGGYMKALRVRCVNVVNGSNEELCMRNIIKCHSDYIELTKYFKMFNSLISPIMFGFLLVITINLAIGVSGIALHDGSVTELLSAVQLMLALLLQLLLIYGVGNIMIVHSCDLAYGVFESEWVSKGGRVRRAVLLLGMGLHQRFVFTAGPFNEMSLATFITILRASYSFFTLLTNVN